MLVVFIGQVILYIPCHIYLIVQFPDFGIGLVGLGHIHVCRHLYIRQQMLAFERGDVIIHIAKLSFNHPQTFVDEHGGADRNLIFVSYPVLVVNGYQGVKHIFCPLGGYILERQCDNVGLLVVLGYIQAGGTVGRCCRQRLAAYINYLFRFIRIGSRRSDDNRA